MPLWKLSIAIAVAGALGGVISALLSEDRGLRRPERVPVDGSGAVWRPGFVGHVVVGAVAAFLSWGMYGPLADEVVLGAGGSGEPKQGFGLTLTALAGAVGVGLGGAKWLGHYVDKQLLQSAAATAASAEASPVLAAKIATAPAAVALKLANAATGRAAEPTSDAGPAVAGPDPLTA